MGQNDIHAVSLAVLSNGRFLLVRRGHSPAKGLFAFPGGRVEEGEDAETAVRRELYEETGLVVDEIYSFREITLEAEGGKRYRLEIFRGRELKGCARAGDDADLAGWYTIEEMRSLPVTASTLEIAQDMIALSEAS
mgnify:CR=1 FL=1